MPESTVCPTCYRTRYSFNNSNTNEVIAKKFEQEYVRCVRNEKEYVCSAPNPLISGNIIKEMPGSLASGTHFTLTDLCRVYSWIKMAVTRRDLVKRI